MSFIASVIQSQSGSPTEVAVVHQREDHKGSNKNSSDNGGALHLTSRYNPGLYISLDPLRFKLIFDWNWFTMPTWLELHLRPDLGHTN